MSMGTPESATVLIVDDTESVIDQLIGFLDGYDLVACTSGEEALSIVASEQIDLILLDIMLPGIDGLEVCRRLQAPAGPACPPVIFITAHDDDTTLQEAFAAGAADYVTKPIRKVELLARVGTQLARETQHRQLRENNRELTSARHALAESEERYRLAMEASRDGLWDWDLVTPSVYYSPGWAHILGEDRVPTDYKAWESRIHPDDRESVLGSLKQYLSGEGGGEVWTCEHRLCHADGSWIWVMGRGRVVQRDDDGRPIRMVGTMIDIGERKRNDQIVALRQLLADMIYTSDVNELMRTALDEAERMTGSEIGFYHFVEADQDTITLQVWSTRTLRDMCYAAEHEQHYPIARAGVWVDCIKQREVVVHNDYESLPHRKGLPAGHAPVIRELTVPVMRDNRVVAVMGVGNKHRPYDDEDKQVVMRISGIAHDFVERKRIEQRIEFMAFNDTLTGLPNKELLLDRLALAMAQSRRANCLLAVCYLDLDGFKPVNDQYGHHTGDALLVALAERLNSGLREGDTLARLGGDEFVILLTGLGGVLDGERIVDRVLRDVSQPFDIDGIQVSVTGSIGVTLYPTDDVDADGLLRHADKAMYKAKDAGRSVYMLYDPLQEQEIRSRLQLVKEFQQALSAGQLELYFQPRIDLRSGIVVGAEGLLRWNHPEHGQLLPGHFLKLIHGGELEFELDEWVLRQAVEQHMRWREAGLKLPVSINITPRQLARLEFAVMVANVLAAYPEDVSRSIELEIIESTSVADVKVASTIMRECVRLGVRFALDDFGAGYASLVRLQNLPVDVLKIDQQYVHGMLEDERDLTVIEGVLRVAADLKNPVVAEGVETVEAAFMLLQLGCQYAQGFGIARPMPAAQMPDWLQRWSESNVWHRLYTLARQLPGPHDFTVSLFCHQHWWERFESSVRARDADEGALLNEMTCSLDKWYRGIGQARYGNRTGFAFVPPRHLRVHDVAAGIVDSMRAGKFDEAIAQLGELKTCSDALLAALRNLQALPVRDN